MMNDNDDDFVSQYILIQQLMHGVINIGAKKTELYVYNYMNPITKWPPENFGNILSVNRFLLCFSQHPNCFGAVL